MRSTRWWFLLLYALATVLAPGVHDHGDSGEAHSAAHESGCADPRPHLSGHWSPDLSQAPDHCLACQYRSQHQVASLRSLAFLAPTPTPTVEVLPPPTRSGAPRRISVRGPPLV